MYLFFADSYIASKIENKTKMEEKVTMGLKSNLKGTIRENYWFMMILNLSSDNIRNCEETNVFVKESKEIIKCKKKRTLNLTYKQELLFQKSTES